MKKVLFGVALAILSGDVFSHGKHESGDCDLTSLAGDWNVFYPKGFEEKGDTIEENTRLHIVVKDKVRFSAILEGSDWEATGTNEPDCRGDHDEIPTLAIEIMKQGDKSKITRWLCVDRVTTFWGLQKRVNQQEPKLQQLGIGIMSDKVTCLHSGPSILFQNPGHAHADD